MYNRICNLNEQNKLKSKHINNQCFKYTLVEDKGELLIVSHRFENCKISKVEYVNDLFQFFCKSDLIYISNISILNKFSYVLDRYFVNSKDLSILRDILKEIKCENIFVKKDEQVDIFVSKIVLSGGKVLYNNFDVFFVILKDSNLYIVSKCELVFDDLLSFSKCKCKRVYISNMNVTKVNDFSWMFACCSELEYVHFENFDTRNSNSFYGMFEECYKLQEVNVEVLNTSNVVNMRNMFRSCFVLQNLNVKYFDMKNVKTLLTTFKDCYQLNYLDISNWQLNNIKDFSYLFDGCENLDLEGKEILERLTTKPLIQSDHWNRHCIKLGT